MTIGTPAAVVMDGRDAMLAVGMNGEPLPVEHGFPVRMVVPGLYGYVSACKWIVDIEATTFAAAAYWVGGLGAAGRRSSWPRASTPRGRRAGHRRPAGHDRRGGLGPARRRLRGRGAGRRRPVEPARLARVPSIDTWQQWVYCLDAGRPAVTPLAGPGARTRRASVQIGARRSPIRARRQRAGTRSRVHARLKRTSQRPAAAPEARTRRPIRCPGPARRRARRQVGQPIRRRRRPGRRGPSHLRPDQLVGALITMRAGRAALWVVQIVNSAGTTGLDDRSGCAPAASRGLRGVFTAFPALELRPPVGQHRAVHPDRLGGPAVRGAALARGSRDHHRGRRWPAHLAGRPGRRVIVGASGLVIGWLGYLLGRAYFSRRSSGSSSRYWWCSSSAPARRPAARRCTRTSRGRRTWAVSPPASGPVAAAPARRRDPAAGPPGRRDRRAGPIRRAFPIGRCPDRHVRFRGRGLTVARAVLDQLPHEALHYVGDTAHSPTAPSRSPRSAVTPSRSWTSWSPPASRRWSSPATAPARPACAMPANGTTCRSSRSCCRRSAGRSPPRATARWASSARSRRSRAGPIRTPSPRRPGIEVYSAACPRFAEFVERGVTSGRQLLGLAESYLAPLNAAGIDTLVLGCTHYPLLTGLLSVVMGDSVTLVSSAEETAKDVYRVLLAQRSAAPRRRARRRGTFSGPPGRPSSSPAWAGASSGPEDRSAVRHRRGRYGGAR